MSIYKNKQLLNKNRCIVRKKISNGVHFIGIGGIGVSALAQYYLKKGHKITGSDLVCSEITEALKKKGVKIFIGKHKTKNLPKDVDLVIYSPAIQKTNLELKRAYKIQDTKHPARAGKIQILSYPEALGELTKEYFTIAISGTHGKSTTTAMIGLLLVKAGLNPTVIVGTKVKEFGNSNCRVGKPIRRGLRKVQYLVIEVDEHFASFLNYSPDIAVITNIEPDHLDYYKNFNNVKKAFAKFTKKLKKNGILITEREYKKTKDAKKLKKILKVPGEHNVYNALAALAVARTLKIPDKISFKALSEYRGCWRRFEIKKFQVSPKDKPTGQAGFRFQVISDYAHHPTEVKATLETAREKYPKKRIWCVFQPHQYLRTHCLFNDFVKVLKTALRPTQDKPLIDKIIVTDIYDVPGRENKNIKKKVSSEKLIKAINRPEAIYLPKEKIIKYLQENLQGGEMVIIMGAGDIYQIISNF